MILVQDTCADLDMSERSSPTHLRFVLMYLHGSAYCCLNIVPLWLWCVKYFYRMGPTRDLHQGGIIEILLELECVQCGRHHYYLQVRSLQHNLVRNIMEQIHK